LLSRPAIRAHLAAPTDWPTAESRLHLEITQGRL
jgi:hypothetical protein